MKNTLIATAILAATCAAAEDIAAAIKVSGVTFSQDKATRKVTVNYNLSGEPAFVSFDVLTNGVSIGVDKLQTVTGDISLRSLQPIATGERSFVWDAKRDWNGNLSEDAQVEVKAYYNTELAGPYMVIDLSGEEYSISSTCNPPDPLAAVPRSTQLWLRRIEPGSYTIGSPTTENGRDTFEEQHPVTLTKPFYIGVFPVTRAQYKNIFGSIHTQAVKGDSDFAPAANCGYYLLRGTNCDGTHSNTVAETSFIGVLRRKTGGRLFDFPTQAQWEYACRAGTVTAFNNGTEFTGDKNSTTCENLDPLAWYGFANDSSLSMKEVGQKLPNAWGLYDCHGLIWEFCLDWLSTTQPEGIDPVAVKVEGTLYGVLKGGYITNTPYQCRSARTLAVMWQNTANHYGFRLCLTAE